MGLLAGVGTGTAPPCWRLQRYHDASTMTASLVHMAVAGAAQDAQRPWTARRRRQVAPPPRRPLCTRSHPPYVPRSLLAWAPRQRGGAH